MYAIRSYYGFDFLDDKPKSAKIEIKTEGDIKINGDKDYIYSNVNDIDNKNITIELLKPYTNGYGKINATLYTYDKGGRDLYAISRSLYYHISDEGVLLSINSLYELERRHVDKLLEAGKIDKKQHRELMDELRITSYNVCYTKLLRIHIPYTPYMIKTNLINL